MRAKFINENMSFERSNDALKDLNIGKRIKIEKWLNIKENFVGYYCINRDLTIDVNLKHPSSSAGINFGNIPDYIKFNFINSFEASSKVIPLYGNLYLENKTVNDSFIISSLIFSNIQVHSGLVITNQGFISKNLSK